jgi:hypothetical protein
MSAPPASAAGIYVDAAGGRHGWKVNGTHALIWEEKPYLPVGLSIRAVSLTTEATPEAWDADRALLEHVRAAGAGDVLVRSPGPLTAAPADALQRWIDALESQGLRYGFALEARPSASLDAYVMDLVKLPVTPMEIAPGARSSWKVSLPGARHAVWAIVDQSEGIPIVAGNVPVQNDEALIEVSFRPANRIFAPKPAWLIVVPRRSLDVSAADMPLNLWAGFAEFQQDLVRYLKTTRWGPGLRFLVNPLPRDLGLTSAGDAVVPASPEFVTEFRGWLSRRYSANDLLTAWAFNERAVESVEIAARLVPLWRSDQGGKLGWFVDPEVGQIYRVEPQRSRYWADLARFRADNARLALSRLADAIKEDAVDVPVIYEWTHHHSVYILPQGSQGMDGMGLVAVGRSELLVTEQAGPFAAQCSEAPRDCWALATAWRPLATSALDAISPPQSPEEAFQQLRSLGLKGFFLESDVAEPGALDPTIATIFQQARAWSADSTAATYRPAVFYYPVAGGTAASVRPLAEGIWWLPSMSRGQRLFLGETIEGYYLEGPFSNLVPTLDAVSVFWAPGGQEKTTFVLPKLVPVQLFDLRGQPRKTNQKGDRLLLTLDATPVVVRGVQPGMVFPVEATAAALDELAALIQRAEAQRIDPVNLASFRLVARNAGSIFTPATAVTVYDLVRTPIAVLREALSPFIWMEGERAVEHNFTGVATDRRASDNALLLLARAGSTPGDAYRALYQFEVVTDGVYDFWLSSAAPGGLGAAGLQWQLDDDPPIAAGAPPTVGKAYGAGLSWAKLGQVRLRPGRHALTLLVPAKGGATDRYQLSVDALVLAREAFVPNGPVRPHWSARAQP